MFRFAELMFIARKAPHPALKTYAAASSTEVEVGKHKVMITKSLVLAPLGEEDRQSTATSTIDIS